MVIMRSWEDSVDCLKAYWDLDLAHGRNTETDTMQIRDLDYGSKCLDKEFKEDCGVGSYGRWVVPTKYIVFDSTVFRFFTPPYFASYCVQSLVDLRMIFDFLHALHHIVCNQSLIYGLFSVF